MPSPPILGPVGNGGEGRGGRVGLRQDERLYAITEVVMQAGTIRITDLSEMFGVSAMTIHRDLDALDAKGILRKTRGQVTAIASSLFDASAEYRLRQRRPEKEAVCRAAFELIESGQSIILDDSSTGVHLAELLLQRPPLTVITNFQRVITLLSGWPGIAVISTGGLYYQWGESFMGAETTAVLQSLRADICFLSATAITDGMCMHPHHDAVAVKRAMFDAAAKRVLYVDHAKFEKRALHAHHHVSDFDVVIVDDGVAPADLEMLQGLDVELVIAPVSR